MNRQQILERERNGARTAGICAIAIVPLYLLSSALDPQTGPIPFTGLATEQYRAINEHATSLLVAAGVRGISLALMVVPLLYLFRAAQARSERVSGPMLGFVFIGPILLALQLILVAIAKAQVASDFVAQMTPGGDIYTLLDDLRDDSTLFQVGVSLGVPALLGLLVAMVYVPLQAMRVGLVTRFFGTLGMALGVSTVVISPVLSLFALVIWFGWLGFIYLGRVPRGRPPAWDAGEAIPWPKAGDAPVEPAPAAVVEGDATEVFADQSPAQPPDHSARRERARKRKRKRRR